MEKLFHRQRMVKTNDQTEVQYICADRSFSEHYTGFLGFGVQRNHRFIEAEVRHSLNR